MSTAVGHCSLRGTYQGIESSSHLSESALQMTKRNTYVAADDEGRNKDKYDGRKKNDGRNNPNRFKHL